MAFPSPAGRPSRASLPTAVDRAAAPRRPDSVFPAEIAFLRAHGVGSDVLVEAAELAERTAVTADAALLASGAVCEATFYTALARHVGAVYYEGTFALAPVASAARTIAAGMAPAAGNPHGVGWVLAPRGRAIAALLAERRRCTAPAPYAIAAPRRFAAAVREAKSATIAADAVRDLIVDGRNLSARLGPSLAQVAVLDASSAAAMFGSVMAPTMACFGLGLPILLAILVRLTAIAVGAPPKAAAATQRMRDVDLPVYTILVPLFREARVAAKLVRSLDRLDYPHARLDIKLLIEAADTQTRDALLALDLPARYEILIAPPGHPRTKPRALNIGLAMARGSLLVVYDAEDEPDPDQLRAAARRFATATARLACLQAKLAIHNMADGWLARLFAVDYGALFDVVNPGMAALRLPILLGGTSNHFRGIM